MFKFKKVISPILMAILTPALIVVILGITFFHIVNINTLKNSMEKVEYYNEVELNISQKLKSYMDSATVDTILKGGRVREDIDRLINSINNNTIELEQQSVLKDFNSTVLANIGENNTESADVKTYAGKISNVYISSLFPLGEIKLIQDFAFKIKNGVIYGLVIALICIILTVLYLLNAGKQRKWIFVSIYNCIILSLILILIMSNFSSIYYSNNAVTSVIQTLINIVMLDIGIMTGILGLLVIILNYFEYFKKEKRVATM